MLTSEAFHCQLMAAVCGQDNVTTSSCSSKEHQQQLALDILCWIVAIQMNDIGTRYAQLVSHIETDSIRFFTCYVPHVKGYTFLLFDYSYVLYVIFSRSN